MFEKKQKWRIIDVEKGIIVDEEDEKTSINDLIYFCRIKFDVLGFSNEHINFMIGNKEYVVKIKEVKDGEHWSEK